MALVSLISVRDRVAFSTSYPELNTAVLGHPDNERFVGATLT